MLVSRAKQFMNGCLSVVKVETEKGRSDLKREDAPVEVDE
ncbi:hypothetical protein C5S31_10035 [ANME-1 cluster archaeon GoMg2]|nr:hypothetical protein [ANME-1 cluster archaeon GoMg2]